MRDDLLVSFVEESLAHIDEMENDLLAIEDGSGSPERIHRIFRGVHSIKGTAGFFHLEKIVGLSQQMETLFAEIRDRELEIGKETTDHFLLSLDRLRELLLDVDGSNDAEIDTELQYLEDIKSRLGLESAGKEERALSVQTERMGENPEKLNGDMDADIRNGFHIYRYVWQTNQIIPLEKLVKEVLSFGKIYRCSLVPLETGSEELEWKLEMLFCTVLEEFLLPEELFECRDGLTELLMDSKAQEEKGKKASVDIDQKKPWNVERKGKEVEVGRDSGIRISIPTMDRLLNLSGELLLAKNTVLKRSSALREVFPELEVAVQGIHTTSAEIQSLLMQARLQPLRRVFGKFPRLIRDLSNKLDKEIRIEISGENVELDRTILDKIGDPLTHLVRNAADHGIESPSVRERKGKGREGLIVLSARSEGGYVYIDVRDDGGGIVEEKIARKARERGILTEQESRSIEGQQCLQLIFHPGFSTVSDSTEISGRGVGLDVVKTNVEGLGGKVEVYSEIGVGTTFRLALPITLAVAPSLLVKAEKQFFVLPQIHVKEIVRMKANEPGKRIETLHETEFLSHRGEWIPVLRLSDLLGIERTYLDPLTGQIKTDSRKKLFDYRRMVQMTSEQMDGLDQQGERRKYRLKNIVRILLIRMGSKTMGLAVDEILGSEEVLIKPLPVHLKAYRQFSGVTLLQNGSAALILEPVGLFDGISLQEADIANQKDLSMEEKEVARSRKDILLFRGSDSMLYGIRLSKLERIVEENGTDEDPERIAASDPVRYRILTKTRIPEEGIPALELLGTVSDEEEVERWKEL